MHGFDRAVVAVAGADLCQGGVVQPQILTYDFLEALAIIDRLGEQSPIWGIVEVGALLALGGLFELDDAPSLAIIAVGGLARTVPGKAAQATGVVVAELAPGAAVRMIGVRSA